MVCGGRMMGPIFWLPSRIKGYCLCWESVEGLSSSAWC